MVMRRLCGMKIKEVAKEFNLSLSRTATLLSRARRAGYREIAGDKLLMLLPKAVAVVDTHLTMGDKDVAMEVLKGVGLLKGLVNEPVGDGDTETFEAWRYKLTRRTASAESQTDPPVDGETIDAEFRPEPQGEAGTGAGDG